jgi:hypothetical protein
MPERVAEHANAPPSDPSRMRTRAGGGAHPEHPIDRLHLAMLQLALAPLTLLVTAAPPTDPEAEFATWAATAGLELFRIACDVDETLGVTCYGVDETRTPTVATWEDGTFVLLEPTEPGMVSTDALLTMVTPLDCASALGLPGLLVEGLALGDADDVTEFDNAVAVCTDVVDRMSANPDSDPQLLALVVAISNELAAIAADHAAGVEIFAGTPAGTAHIEALGAAWQALVEYLAG